MLLDTGKIILSPKLQKFNFNMKITAISSYFVGVWSELKKVNWPTPAQVANHTVIVLVSGMIAMGITAALDYGLTQLVQYIVQNRS